jgi:hypothetical protein
MKYFEKKKKLVAFAEVVMNSSVFLQMKFDRPTRYYTKKDRSLGCQET